LYAKVGNIRFGRIQRQTAALLFHVIERYQSLPPQEFASSWAFQSRHKQFHQTTLAEYVKRTC
jgi:hypothetical protein